MVLTRHHNPLSYLLPRYQRSIGAIATELRMQSSPFVRLLESNDPPDEGEIVLIRRFLDENRARLDELRTMPQSTPEVDQLERCIQAHTALLSPIRCVPGELLSEIFTYSSYKRKVGTHRIDAPPWPLGYVCRTWRNAALSTSLLWRRLTIYEPRSTSATIHMIFPLSMIETQLVLSGNATLDIWMNVRSRGSAGHHKDLLHALLQHSHRWRVFNMCLRGSEDLVPALSGMYNRIPQLREFILTQDNLQPGEGHSYLSEAPALRRLILTGSTLRARSPYIPTAPWDQIIHYRASGTAQQNFDILLATPGLVQCGLGFIKVDSEVEYHAGRHVVLPCLRRLRLGVAPEPARDFLAHITAGPTLESLTVCAPYTAVPSFLHRSSSGRLTCLYLDNDHRSTTAEEIVNVLRDAPVVRTLGILCGAPSDHEMGPVWSAMTIQDRQGAANILCPVLKSLVYTCRGEHEAIDPPFFPMVQSRCSEYQGGGATLHSLRVVAIDTLPEFVESLRQGMVSLPDELKSQVLEGKEGRLF
ncbi:hypothetical protein FB45DRAFT_1102984 [Roridomyces roridus]|uniref:F-box domain-containing protein n=1 Tax=Roridomyces roridus TaxID=1738132 RepID=A0AAD7BD72_9AGAR|nr:hypothetical protein FB45DRAFT_1102984 [Roridomyces roridus]